MKIHGHRAQIHVSHNPDDLPVVYNRQGRPHSKDLSPPMIAELRRLFAPRQEGWNAIDAEWIKSDEKLYVFDFLKYEGKTLSRLSYEDRYLLLPTDFISPYIQVLPLLTRVDRCLEVLASPSTQVEGLVFKSKSTIGFADTAIVRCRKPGARN